MKGILICKKIFIKISYILSYDSRRQYGIQRIIDGYIYISKRIRETRKEIINKAVAWLESQGSKYNNEVVMVSIDDFKKAIENEKDNTENI